MLLLLVYHWPVPADHAFGPNLRGWRSIQIARDRIQMAAEIGTGHQGLAAREAAQRMAQKSSTGFLLACWISPHRVQSRSHMAL